MENKKLSNLNAGLLLFLLMVVFTLIINMGGFQRNSKLNWLSYLIIVCGITLLVIKYGKDMGNNVTFGNLFGYGFKTIAITTIFFIAFSLLFYTVFPEYKTQLLEISRENAMQKATPENREQMEKGIEMFQRFFWVAMIAGILVSFAILGAIGSLIGAAIAKKEPNQVIE
jgi:NADH:ubiquinone oxidoreductase subunit 6 (subunit J)